MYVGMYTIGLLTAVHYAKSQRFCWQSSQLKHTSRHRSNVPLCACIARCPIGVLVSCLQPSLESIRMCFVRLRPSSFYSTGFVSMNHVSDTWMRCLWIVLSGTPYGSPCSLTVTKQIESSIGIQRVSVVIDGDRYPGLIIFGDLQDCQSC